MRVEFVSFRSTEAETECIPRAGSRIVEPLPRGLCAQTVVLESRCPVATAPGTDKSRIISTVVSTPSGSEAAPIALTQFMCKASEEGSFALLQLFSRKPIHLPFASIDGITVLI